MNISQLNYCRNAQSLNERRTWKNAGKLLLVIAIILCWVYSIGTSDDGENENKSAEKTGKDTDETKEKIGDWLVQLRMAGGWRVTITIRSGSGMEMMRFGWYRIELGPNGYLKVMEFHHLDTLPKNGKTVYEGQFPEELEKSTMKAVGEAIASMLTTPDQGRAEDGYFVKITAKTSRREITVVSENLPGFEAVGTDFPKLIAELNRVIDPKKTTIKPK